jgi:mono/diheme cytochrome c family protein
MLRGRLALRLPLVLIAGSLLVAVWFAFASDPIQAASPQQVAAAAPASPAAQHRGVLNKYCVTCHNQRLKTAGLTLDTLNIEDIAGGAEVWEKVLLKVRTGAMPPLNMPRPDQAVRDGLTAWLEAELDKSAALKPNPGRIAVHRLNRGEYANAIRDLLALEIDSRSVLVDEDPAETGFDNTAGSLSVSPVLVERYISAARKVSRLAVGDPSAIALFDTYRVPKMMDQDDRLSEDLPFASRGGIAIRHRFPVDGEYVVKIRLQSQLYQYILGLGRPHPLEVRLDGARIKQFIVGGDAPGQAVPDSYAGDAEGSPDWEKYMHFADAGLEVRFPVKAGTRVVGVAFAEYTPEPEGVVQPIQAGPSGLTYNHLYYDNPQIETVQIGGPYQAVGPGETPSRQKIFVCRPKSGADEPACAKEILSTLARRAYRRPVTEADVQTLLTFYNAGRKQGTFDSGIQSGLTRILADPEFLVRIERDPANAAPGTVYRLSDLALASRLSFFLWSSIPDDELLDLAARGRLKDPKVLDQQVRRMLGDARSKTLTDNFAAQWLNLPKLRGATPDPDEFPDFDENLRDAFAQETRLFLDSQIRANASVLELLTAKYTFLNERLARHYQIPNVYGNAFRRVTLDNDRRGGILGQGSVLTVTSYANRTSPVFRGKWVLENLLAAPPPPPPPDVEGLKENEPDKLALSMRERMEAHRKNPSCSVCHSRMDPLGFALENFDGVGMWRDINEDGSRVDASSALPDGSKLSGIAGLRTYLLNRREQFAGAIAEKLLAYALGRGVEHTDLPAVRKISREAAASDYRWAAIIEGIVKSVPFQMSIVTQTQSNAANAPAVAAPSVATNSQSRTRRPVQ